MSHKTFEQYITRRNISEILLGCKMFLFRHFSKYEKLPLQINWINLVHLFKGIKAYQPLIGYLKSKSETNNLRTLIWFSSVGLGCRMHRLHLYREVRLPHRVFCIWHYAIWWWGFSNAGSLGNAEYPFIAIASSSRWPVVVAPDRVLSISQIELFDILTACKQMT